LSEVEGEFIEEAVSENNASLRKKKKKLKSVYTCISFKQSNQQRLSTFHRKENFREFPMEFFSRLLGILLDKQTGFFS